MTAQVFIHAVKTASVGQSGTVLTAEKSRQPRGVLRSTPLCREHPSKRHIVSRSGLPRSRPRYRVFLQRPAARPRRGQRFFPWRPKDFKMGIIRRVA